MGSSLSSQPIPCFFTRFIDYGIVILLHAQKHLLKPWGSHMDRLMLHHFQWLVVILNEYMPPIYIGVEFLQTKEN